MISGVVEASYKAKKMVRVTMEIAFDRIRDILLSGKHATKTRRRTRRRPIKPQGTLTKTEAIL